MFSSNITQCITQTFFPIDTLTHIFLIIFPEERKGKGYQ